MPIDLNPILGCRNVKIVTSLTGKSYSMIGDFENILLVKYL